MPLEPAMPRLSAVILLAGVSVMAALAGGDDEPAPLLKPVVPNPNSVRARIATSEEKVGFYHVAASVPKYSGKKMESIAVKAALEVRPGKSYVTAKKWLSWGYEIPANKIGILPELTLSGVQLAPKPKSGGRDIQVRFPGIRLEIIEPPMAADTVLGCDLLLSLGDLTKNTDRAFEPRLYFADQFLELTVPAGSVKRPGTGDESAPEPYVNPDSKLVPVMSPTSPKGVAVLNYSAINGLTRYKTPDGKYVPVNITVSSTTHCPGGIAMSHGAARGCGVELDEGKQVTGIGTDFQTAMVKGKLKELRIGFQTGPGLKGQQDLVLKDVLVWVDKNDSGHMMWIGPTFLRETFKDPVYSCGPDGAWKLHGRLKPEQLHDVKTRPKKP